VIGVVPFSVTLNGSYQDSKGMPLFDVKYLRNGARQLQWNTSGNSNLHTPCLVA